MTSHSSEVSYENALTALRNALGEDGHVVPEKRDGRVIIQVNNRPIATWDADIIVEYANEIVEMLSALDRLEAKTGGAFISHIKIQASAVAGISDDILIVGPDYLHAAREVGAHMHDVALAHEHGHYALEQESGTSEAQLMQAFCQPFRPLMQLADQFATRDVYDMAEELLGALDGNVDNALVILKDTERWLGEAEQCLPPVHQQFKAHPILAQSDKYAVLDAITHNGHLQDDMMDAWQESHSFIGRMNACNKAFEWGGEQARQYRGVGVDRIAEKLKELRDDFAPLLEQAVDLQRIEQAVRHAEELYCDMHALELAEHPEQVSATWQAFSHSLQKRQALREYGDFAKRSPEVFDAYSAVDRKAYADALGLVSPDNQEQDFTHAVITQEIVWRNEKAGSASVSHPSAQEREEFLSDYADGLQAVMAERGKNWADRFKETPQAESGNPASRINHNNDSERTR